MLGYRGTADVAKALGVPPSRLHRAINEGLLDAPAMGPGHCYAWGPRDVERAAWIICHKPLSAVLRARRPA